MQTDHHMSRMQAEKPIVAEMDDRIPTFRWAKVNGKKKRHLWLGHETACGGLLYGDNVHTLVIAYPIPACGKCLAYARGWLNRHDTGERPQLGKPDPTGYGTRLLIGATS